MTNTPYSTSDLHLSCFLIVTHNGKFRGLQWQDGNAKFIFNPPPSTDAINSFLTGGEASAALLFATLRQLRTAMRETKPAGEVA